MDWARASGAARAWGSSTWNLRMAAAMAGSMSVAERRAWMGVVAERMES